ncbi:MAG: DUF2007 domain-containing protein [Hyphomicrobiaceae bacterium]
MREIIRSNDPVVMSFAQVLLRDAGMETVVADQNMSIMEGSIGVFPRRLLVLSDEWLKAERVLVEADLGEWIWRDG